MNWISVKDRLPEHEQQVLVYFPAKGSEYSRVETSVWWAMHGSRPLKHPRWWLGCDHDDGYIPVDSPSAPSHWCPIPAEPPQ